MRGPGDGERAAQPNAVRRAVAAHAPQELELVASFERELHVVPPGLEELVRLRRAGADRATLVRAIGTELPRDFAVRALAHRWVRDVTPEPSDAPDAPVTLVQAQVGRLGGLTRH